MQENDAGIDVARAPGLLDGVQAARAPARSVMPVDNSTGLPVAAMRCRSGTKLLSLEATLSAGTSGSSMATLPRSNGVDRNMTPALAAARASLA